MTRMVSGGVKGLAGLAVVWFTYVNDTFSPLFWVLLALVFVDLVLNIHKEGMQFQKLGSAAVAMGIPGFISANVGHPGFARVLVAMMCLVYIQHVVPQLMAKIAALTAKKDSPVPAIDAAMVEQIVQLLAAKGTSAADAVIASTKQAGTGSPSVQPSSVTENSNGTGA